MKNGQSPRSSSWLVRKVGSLMGATAAREGLVAQVLAAVGIFLLVVSSVLLFSGRNSWLLEGVFLTATLLLLIAAIIALQSERGFIQFLAFVGIALFLLALGLAQGLTRTQSAPSSPQIRCSVIAPAPVPTLPAGVTGVTGSVQIVHPKKRNVARLGLALSIQWPANMDIDGSEFVGLALKRAVVPKGPAGSSKSRGKSASSLTISVGGQNCSPSTPGRKPTVVPITLGTPGVPVENAFGKGYEAEAAARLSAVQFNATPNTTEWQVLDPSGNQWAWTITASKPGRQVIILNLDMRWKPLDTGKGQLPEIDRPIWESNPHYVNVQEPLLIRGQIQASTIVNATLVTGLGTLITALIAKIFPSRS